MADVSDLGDPERLDIARQFLAHLGGREVAQTLELLSPSVTYHVLGDHALGGVFTGRDAVADHLISIVERTSGRFDAVKYEDWMLGLHHVGTLVNIHVERDGAKFLGRHLILLRFNSDNKIDYVTVFDEDADATRRFYGPKFEQA